jgi:hypothetical protein
MLKRLLIIEDDPHILEILDLIFNEERRSTNEKKRVAIVTMVFKKITAYRKTSKLFLSYFLNWRITKF